MGNVNHFKKLKIKLWIFISLFFILILSAVTLVLASVERDKYEELMYEHKGNLSKDFTTIIDKDLETDIKNTFFNKVLGNTEILSTYIKCKEQNIQFATFMGDGETVILDEDYYYKVPVREKDEICVTTIGYLNYYELFKDNLDIFYELYGNSYSYYLEGYLDGMEIHPSKIEFYKMEEGIIFNGEEKVPTLVKNVYYEINYDISDTSNMVPITIDQEQFTQVLFGLLINGPSNPNNSSYKHLYKEYKKFLKDSSKLLERYEDKYINLGGNYYDETNRLIEIDRYVIYTDDKSFSGLFKIKESEVYIYGDTMLAYELVAYPIKPAIITLIPLYFVSIFLIPLMHFIIMSFINKLREIENKEEEKRQALTTAVAHELKTPLGIIKTHNEGLQDNIDKDKEIEYRNVINNEINHMDSLILDLLQLSKLESKRMELKLEEIDLVELAHNQKLKLQNLYQKKNITFEILSNDEVLVYADLKLMMLVYSNILTNAIKNVRDNGNIKIEIEQTKNMAIVKFINNGPKLTQAEINNIWDTFYMKDKSRKHELGSTGLGLTIVKAILKLHNAKYGCENTEDGVCFWITLKK